jgi:hypothetical protein
VAIRIECKQCGFKNDLGKVFCAQCGKRLDLDHTSLEQLADRAEFDWVRFTRNLVSVVFVVILVAGVVFALSPRIPAGIKADPAGAQIVTQKARWLKSAARQRATVSALFQEADLNGFLAQRRQAQDLKNLWIDVRPGEFELGAVRRITPTNTPVALTISFGLTAAFEQNRLVVRQGQLGHIPLPGPAAGLTQKWFAEIFSDVITETNLIAAIKNVRFDQDQAEVYVGR